MKRPAIYAIVFVIGIITAMIVSFSMFSKLQYIVYRLNKVAGIIHCDEAEPFCQGAANESRFDGMNTTSREQWVQSQSAYLSTAMSLVSGTVGLFTIIPLGIISDRYGRKAGLIIACVGFALETILNSIVMLLHLPLWVLIVATLPSSILGNGICGIFTQLYVCITDLTEQKAEVFERRLSTVSRTASVTLPLPHQTGRRRTSSILEKGEPKSLATVQSSMSSERLSYIALFEGTSGITMAVSTMGIGPAISRFGFVFPSWFMLGLTVLNLGLSFVLPNTRALWCNPGKGSEILKGIDLDSRRKLLSISSDIKEEPPNPAVVVTPPTPIPKRKINCWVTLKRVFSFLTVPILIGVFADLLASMVAQTDVAILNLYFIRHPFAMTVSQVAITIGIRSIGCSMVSGLFVVFNMFYLQPRLAKPNIKQTNLKKSKGSGDGSNDAVEDIADLTDAEIVLESHNKMLEARRIMLFILGSIFLIMAVSRFLYGISSNFEKPTCQVLMFIGLVLNSFLFYGPLIRALLSGLTSCEVQGILYALIGFGDAFGGYIGSTSFPLIYASTVGMNAGFVFHMTALILALAFILTAINTYLLLYGKYK